MIFGWLRLGSKPRPFETAPQSDFFRKPLKIYFRVYLAAMLSCKLMRQ
jgi:hypothetical protein